jgi:hypothetical protein
MGFWGWCGVVLAASLVSACSGSGGTDSDSAGGGAATTTSAAWATPDGTVPSSSVNRPSELSVDDVNPCDLLTEDQRGTFGLTGEQTSELSSTWSTDSCTTWDADKVLSTSVAAVSTDGIDIFYRGRFTNMQYKPTVVRGFPALFYRFDDAEHACYLAVDVADGQLVDVSYGAKDPESSDASQNEVCDTALSVTEAAMDTLLSSQ